MPTETEREESWLTRDELEDVRGRVPMLYVIAVPVRVGEAGDLDQVGLLLRASDTGRMERELVAGRVLYHERIRDALVRHLEKDLGPMALPRIPVSPQPLTVAEFFPTPGVTPYHDPRQHAVALVFAVPVHGDCAPQQDALELAWLTPSEAASTDVEAEMAGGHAVLLRQVLAHLGQTL
ncbi:NUDIX hydrolase family protein [Janibacter alkaliphilus]|uniref:8-oxo-dGTP pyrophosphatase MutT (NUDIX family) n=1 Tax=Janibacter alkaliphilus TaxID=1069963 RepID=A0A852X820_9MICO|nr:NUDIX hydrolase family protein [Janibacter alkaliphilus]NYG38567.1 8-oxo-dGTP pyrophosphatase MutT (NUDIX family) [Janibacter alkaliphilus]